MNLSSFLSEATITFLMKNFQTAPGQSLECVPSPLGTLLTDFFIFYPNSSTSLVTETDPVDSEVQAQAGRDLRGARKYNPDANWRRNFVSQQCSEKHSPDNNSAERQDS